VFVALRNLPHARSRTFNASAFPLIDFTQFTLTALYAYSEAILRLQLLTGVELGIILCDSGSPATHDPRMWATTATSNFE
jgi:hypothetical protein